MSRVIVTIIYSLLGPTAVMDNIISCSTACSIDDRDLGVRKQAGDIQEAIHISNEVIMFENE